MATVTDWLSKQTSYAYDNAGNLSTTTYPTGRWPRTRTATPTACSR
jgi:YD repeat-containing protein